ncbi:MAG: 30S ribosomal protein S2 [Phycisphaerales bacterium]
MTSLVRDLIEAGIHFGQRSSNWNPKMGAYIFGTRKQIHIIDIKETVKGLLLAKKFVQRVTGDGKDVLFVGTKRQARASIERHAADMKMPYVIERWLGGTLTNFRTIRERLKRLIELENLVESGEIQNYSKKMESQLTRELRRIKRNLEGIRHMDKLPGCLVVVDVNREVNALREAANLGIPTIALIDTDGNPDMVDLPIPGNDDSMRSIDVVVRELCASIAEGKAGRQADERAKDQGGDDASGDSRQRGRSRRSQFRAADSVATSDEDIPAAQPEKADGANAVTS